MRKVFIALASCAALVAAMAFSASAFALQDPTCAAAGNPSRVIDFTMQTPDSSYAYAISSVRGKGYGCGSDISDGFGGAETLNNHADIGVPPGVEVADSDLVPVGSYAAMAKVNILFHGPFGGSFFDNGIDGTGVPSIVRTDNKANCQNEIDNEITGPTPHGTIVSCLYGFNPTGFNWNWSTRDAQGKLWTTIGPMHGIGGIEPGLTMVDLTLCEYFGAVGGDACGTGGQWQQKNGDYSVYFLPGGEITGLPNYNGIYSARVVNEAGEVSNPAAYSKVQWFPYCAPGDVPQKYLVCDPPKTGGHHEGEVTALPEVR